MNRRAFFAGAAALAVAPKVAPADFTTEGAMYRCTERLLPMWVDASFFTAPVIFTREDVVDDLYETISRQRAALLERTPDAR